MAITKPDYTQLWASGGDKITPSDVKIQSGWGPEIPPYQWENWIQGRQDQMLAHITERGIPEWDGQTEYLADGKSYVQGSNGIIYKSVAASGPSTTVQDPATDDTKTYWTEAFSEVGTVTVVTTSQSLTSANIGTVLISVAADATITLPLSADVASREILLQRRDTTTNVVVIAASGADKLMLDTTAEAAGQATTELLFAGDYLRLRSDGAGKWWCVGQAELPGSIASGLVVFADAGIHDFEVPAVLRSGRRVPTVTVTGAGGAGGECSNPTGRGAGGSAGGTAIKRVDLSGVSSVPVTVGEGDTGDGGSSSFGVYCSATGGVLGDPYTGSTAAGPIGGIGIGGDLNIPGGPGSDGPVQGGVGDGGSGDGGASFWGGGGRSASGVGLDGEAPGTGGGGSKLNNRSKGAHGIVKIEW